MSTRIQSWQALLILMGVWMISHPYEGFVHDGVLYAGQALRHLPGAGLGGDVFFGAASQDDYTIFGRLYGALADWIGLPQAALALYVLGQLAWFCVALAWIRSTAPALALAGVAGLLALRYSYGPENALDLAESFVTARLLAESLSLAGLLLAVHGKRASAVALVAAALILHPLMAAPVIGVLAIQFVGERFGNRIAVAAAFAAAIALAGGALAYSPRMDDAWLQELQTRTPGMLPSGWRLDQLAKWALTIVMLLVAAKHGPRRFASLWRSAALVGALGVGLAVIAFQAHWAALIQVQTWRAMWLCAWLGPLAVVSACLALPGEWRGARIRLLSLVPAFVLAQQSWVPWGATFALAYAFIVAFSIRDTRGWFDRDEPDGAIVLAMVISLAALAGAGIGVVKLAMAPELAIDRQVRTFAVHCFGWAAAVAIGWWATGGRAAGQSRSRRLPLTALAVAIAGSLLVDARTPIARETQRLHEGALAQWQSIVPSSAQVLWPDRLRYVWLGLGRSSYASLDQAAGGMIDRATALETQRRLKALQRLSDTDVLERGAAVVARLPHMGNSTVGIHGYCALDPRPDFVVLPHRQAAAIGAPYREPFSGKVYQLHSCAVSGRSSALLH